MIAKCGTKDKQRILSYIGTDYSLCLYLYLNLLRYGFDSGTVEVFSQEAGEGITAVLLKYYTCLHIYSGDNSFDAEEIVRFFTSNSFTMIYCAAESGKKLSRAFPGAIKTKATNGWVARIEGIDREPRILSVPANADDFGQIVRLIYDDEDIGRSYNYEDLARQLVERNEEGYARNLVIRHDDTVIAHVCTNAESDCIAVVAELLVRKEYRRKGYASDIMRAICDQLLSEGKEVYSFYYSEESRNLHKRVGFYEICEWSKIVIDR